MREINPADNFLARSSIRNFQSSSTYLDAFYWKNTSSKHYQKFSDIVILSSEKSELHVLKQ